MEHNERNTTMRKTVILTLVFTITVLAIGFIIHREIERQTKIDLMIQQNQIKQLVRIFNLKDSNGNTGFNISDEECSLEKYSKFSPTYESDIDVSTQEIINNFAIKHNIYYGGKICEFTMKELLNDPIETYKKLKIYNDYVLILGSYDIENIAEGKYNKASR